jgi:methionyl aminopeptidase
MELKKMQEVGQIVAYILKTLGKEIKVGMTGQELEKRALQLMKEKKVKSSIKGYRGFPAAICVSLNNEVTHGIPDGRSFKVGDLVSFDVACHKKDKWGVAHHADAALTVIVDQEKDNSLDQAKKTKLLMVTQTALQKVIEKIQPGITTTQDIGSIIEEYVHSQGYYVIKEYGGHGIGHTMHEKPFIPNYKIPSEHSTVILENTAICVEPLVQIDNAEIKLSKDNNWTVFSPQGKLNAHFEHTIWVGKEKVEILTADE